MVICHKMGQPSSIQQNSPFIGPYENIPKDASQATHVSESEEIRVEKQPLCLRDLETPLPEA